MIFFSTFLYSVAKMAGPAFKEVLAREIAKGPASDVPSIRTMAALTAFEGVTTNITGPTRIAPARSAMAGHFLKHTSDVWVTCDDDTFADTPVLSALVRACRATEGLVSAPSMQRDPHRKEDAPGLINLRFAPGQTTHERIEGDGYVLTPVHATGFGLVALHRNAVEEMAAAYPELEVQDEGTGHVYPALFFERLHNRRWQGEDMAFCARAREIGMPMHGLLGVEVDHDGRRMVLESDGESGLSIRLFDLARS